MWKMCGLLYTETALELLQTCRVKKPSHSSKKDHRCGRNYFEAKLAFRHLSPGRSAEKSLSNQFGSTTPMSTLHDLINWNST